MRRLGLVLSIASFFSCAAAYTATATAPPTVNVKVTNPVLPVEVSNANPIAVTDTAAAGRIPVRFGPMSNPQGALTEVIAPVTEGKILVVTSLHAVLDSLVGTPLTSGLCVLFVSEGSVSHTLAHVQLTPGSGALSWSANTLLSLPLAAGEGLEVSCSGPPAVSQTAIVTATGYYVPAG